MPDDLLSENSVLAQTRAAMTAENCENVEVIGWLYQFYISEKKDEVFAGLKKNKKITPENIPAATQLFTPHWIVLYLVENSLGRLWLLNRPGSGLKAQMEYYIEPEQAETDFLQVGSPEELKICDPACGSGHMLVYAFDLLYAIYEEEGYAPEEIPEKILSCNLYGIEIDERAGALAAFALTMKARERQRGFFRKGVEPNICVLENVRFEEGELDKYMDFIGRDLFTAPLLETLHQFRESDNLGSLIQPVVTDVENMLELLKEKSIEKQLLLYKVHKKVLKVLRQADYLSPKYQAVAANPPYMGGKNMNGELSSWVKDSFPDSKSDLFSAFIERNLTLVQKCGMVGMITMQSWMFLSSFDKLRTQILNKNTISSMAHLGTRAFDSIGGEVVSTTAFVLKENHKPGYKGSYFRLLNGGSEAEKSEAMIEAIADPNCGWFYRAPSEDFKKIPGSVITYWVNSKFLKIYSKTTLLNEVAQPRKGLITLKDALFTRQWYETSTIKNKYDATNHEEALRSGCKWFPITKGGGYRKWFGNNSTLINWEDDGIELKKFIVKRYGGGSYTKEIRSEDYYFQSMAAWGLISSAKPSFRYIERGFLIGNSGPCITESNSILEVLAAVNSTVGEYVLSLFCPTINFSPGDLSKLPVLTSLEENRHLVNIEMLVDKARLDWNASELSWDFQGLPLISENYRKATLQLTYIELYNYWQRLISETKLLEEKNNSIFTEAYELHEELALEVPLDEVTLTCNAHYRYGTDKPEPELEALLLADTLREFISYAVGCMFGRYSLDAPGLILANQGETLTDYLARIPTPTFEPDADNVIPILDGEWFTDDITERFTAFLRTTFGKDHYAENLKFIEDAIGKDIRKFFLKDFYTDHIKRYKKRPIYWLFSSPKGTFNALIYMHRYRPDTVSVILNDYLRQFQTKLQARKSQREQVSISAAASNAEKTRALKDIDKLNKQILELETYERDVLYPLATKQIEIDLDDGVKVNYPKFGKALKKVAGLS